MHLYELGDLDDLFWSKCKWKAVQLHFNNHQRNMIKINQFIALQYRSPDLERILAFGSVDYGMILFLDINEFIYNKRTKLYNDIINKNNNNLSISII